MGARVTRRFEDRETGVTYDVGDAYPGRAERVDELAAMGFVVRVGDEPTEPAPKPATRPKAAGTRAKAARKAPAGARKTTKGQG